jgi:hypothetical protein
LTDRCFDIFNSEKLGLRNLEDFILSNNKISSEGVKVLVSNGGKLPKLKRMVLNYCEISDEGYKFFALHGGNFKKLEWVYLKGNAITDKGK